MRLAFLLALALTALQAQPIEVGSFWQLAPLDGNWRISEGDDARFAAADFDDSAWRTVRVPAKATPLPLGTVWIRLDVQLPDSLPAEPLELLLPPLGISYDVFVNGRQIGSFGDLRVANGWGDRIPAPTAFAIPTPARRLNIAIRNRSTEVNRVFTPGYVQSGSGWIGTAPAIAGKRRQMEVELRWQTVVHLAIMSATAMAGLFFVLLPIWRRDAREYLWCGLFLLSATLFRPMISTPWMLEGVALPLSSAVWTGLGALLFHSFERLFHHLLGVGLSAWARRCQRAALVWLIAAAAACLFRPEWANVGASIRSVLVVSMIGVVYLDLARQSRRTEETRWMHTAVALYWGGAFSYYALRLPASALYLPDTVNVPDLARTVTGVGLLLFAGVMAMVLNRHSARVRSEQQRLAQEMRAGAEMQELLLPAGALQVPGFRTEATYLPMSEVGGDFHYSLQDGGALVLVVGDVSGKGLPAALLVALVIGILRDTAERRPGALLAAMNRALTGQTRGGFVTCCCARFDPDGTVTLANAGHVAPYADGEEIGAEGLPLGLVAGMEYEEWSLKTRAMTFVSDGVVEAANARGELFGFERTRAISMQPAQEIADAARAWGQNDDITVVTVRRAA